MEEGEEEKFCPQFFSSFRPSLHLLEEKVGLGGLPRIRIFIGITHEPEPEGHNFGIKFGRKS